MNIHFVSLGCDKNLVDSEIMIAVLKEDGFELTADENEADICVVNTCGFVKDATQESLDSVLHFAKLKQDGVCKVLIVTGCMVERYKDEIFAEIPEIDAILGVGNFEDIANVVKQALNGEKVNVVTNKNRILHEKYNLKRSANSTHYFAYLKIAEGCDNCCTYCTIPSIRGKYRSRKIEDIVEEAKLLAQNGAREIVIVAQDTANYGVDIYETNKLHVLLSELAKVEQIAWLRIMYAYPEHITDETIDEMAQNEKVCKYLDMPIQHASDSVLKRMGRKMTRKQLSETIKKIRSKMPEISIRTTLIVGFPGETDDEFDELIKFVKKTKFDKLGVFKYSKEDGTPAAKMKNQVLAKVKKKRYNEVMTLQNEISAKKLNKFVGKKMQIIVDGKIPNENVYCGRSFRDAYDVDGIVFFETEREMISGEFVNVKVTECSDYDLVGKLL